MAKHHKVGLGVCYSPYQAIQSQILDFRIDKCNVMPIVDEWTANAQEPKGWKIFSWDTTADGRMGYIY